MQLSLTHHVIRQKFVCLFSLALIVALWVLRCRGLILNIEPSSDSVMPGTTELEFYGFDIVNYYFYYCKDKFYDFPWVIRIAYMVIIVSVMVGACVFLFLFRFVYCEMRSKYRHRLLMRRFHDSICNVLYDANDLSEYEIDRILGLNGVSLKKRVMHDLLGVLIDIHFELGDNNINAHNRDIVYVLLGITQYINSSLVGRNYRNCIRILQTMRMLDVTVQPGLMVRLVNSRHHSLRSLARVCYFMSNNSNPYELLNKDYLNEQFTPWDAINLHECMRLCKKRGRLMPSYMAILNELKEPLVKPYIIYGAGYWGTDDEVKHMAGFFDKDDARCRNAAYTVMGWRKCLSEEKTMMDRYWVENENSRSLIVRDVFEMHSGRAVDFYMEAYNKTASNDTKLQILYALKYYNKESAKVFNELQSKALPEQSILFKHVQNPLIVKQLTEKANERVLV